MLGDLPGHFRRMPRLADDLAQIPKIARGIVWCRICGATQAVDGVKATLGDGWPMCCSQTMTIDSPEERASRRPTI